MTDLQRVWKEFDANEVSHSVAHYLLAIVHHSGQNKAPRAADIARRLDISRAAVSIQLRTLKENGLVMVGKDHRILLTPTGKDLVERILSKRRTIIRFFIEVLGVLPHIAEEDACKIEHLISEESGAAMLRLIRFFDLKKSSVLPLIREFEQLTTECPPGIGCDRCTRQCVLRNSDEKTRTEDRDT